jgi:hypothetical protein
MALALPLPAVLVLLAAAAAPPAPPVPPAAPPSSSASAPAPAAADPCATALFCDGFEDDAPGQPPGPPWKAALQDSGATVTVDAVHAFGGKQAVHASAPRAARKRRAYFVLQRGPAFPAAAQEMYGRVMVWLDAAPVAPAGQPAVHWTLFQGEGRAAGDTHNAIYRFGGQHRGGLGLMANYETTPPTRSDCWQHSALALQRRRQRDAVLDER